MEATGAYHYPILYYLKEKGYFVTLVNPLEMKCYHCQGLRNPKTDRINAKIIETLGFTVVVKFYEGSLEILIVTIAFGHKRYLLLVSINIIILLIQCVPHCAVRGWTSSAENREPSLVCAAHSVDNITNSSKYLIFISLR